MSYSIILDPQRCIHCKAWEIHCQTWHSLPPGVHLGTHLAYPEDIPTQSAYKHCWNHPNAPCEKNCPTKAIYRDSKGFTHINSDVCVGCLKCRKVCPIKLPLRHPLTGKAIKCDMCADRIQEGLEPACVTGCTTKALRLSKDVRDYAQMHRSVLTVLNSQASEPKNHDE